MKLMTAGGWGWGEKSWGEMSSHFVLKMIVGMVVKLTNTLTTMEVYSLSGQIVWYVNDSSLKLFKRKSSLEDNPITCHDINRGMHLVP